MSRNFVNASSQHIFRNSFAILSSAGSRTINIWGRTGFISRALCEYGKDSGFGTKGGMSLGLNATPEVQFEVFTDAASVSLNTTTSVSANEWFMATGVTDGNDHQVYLNAGGVGTDSTNITLANYNKLFIASPLTPANFWDGQIAEIAIWGNVLTQHEIEGMYESRIQALFVRPEELRFYMSMLDDSDYAEFGTLAGASAGTRLDFNSSGSPTVSAEHPPIVRQAGGLF